jgi:hypothetical protein
MAAGRNETGPNSKPEETKMTTKTTQNQTLAANRADEPQLLTDRELDRVAGGMRKAAGNNATGSFFLYFLFGT